MCTVAPEPLICALSAIYVHGRTGGQSRRYGCSWSVGACFARYGGSFRFGRGGNGMAGGPAGSRRQPVFGSRAGARADVRAQGPGCGRDGWRGCCGQLDAGVLQPEISSRHRSCRAGRQTAAHRPRRARRSGSRPAPARPAARPCVTPPASGRRKRRSPTRSPGSGRPHVTADDRLTGAGIPPLLLDDVGDGAAV